MSGIKANESVKNPAEMERFLASISVLRNISILFNFQTSSLNLRTRLKQMSFYSYSFNQSTSKEP